MGISRYREAGTNRIYTINHDDNTKEYDDEGIPYPLSPADTRVLARETKEKKYLDKRSGRCFYYRNNGTDIQWEDTGQVVPRPPHIPAPPSEARTSLPNSISNVGSGDRRDPPGAAGSGTGGGGNGHGRNHDPGRGPSQPRGTGGGGGKTAGTYGTSQGSAHRSVNVIEDAEQSSLRGGSSGVYEATQRLPLRLSETVSESTSSGRGVAYRQNPTRDLNLTVNTATGPTRLLSGYGSPPPSYGSPPPAYGASDGASYFTVMGTLSSRDSTSSAIPINATSAATGTARYAGQSKDRALNSDRDTPHAGRAPGRDDGPNDEKARPVPKARYEEKVKGPEGKTGSRVVDPNIGYSTLVWKEPPKKITEESLLKQNIKAQAQVAGAGRGVDEPVPSNPSFRMRDHGFFVVGRVFRVIWVEPAGQTMITGLPQNAALPPGVSRTAAGVFSFSKARLFVVIRTGMHRCSALPIMTYRGQGVSKKNVKKSDHAIIYSQGVKPQLLDIEQPRRGEEPMRQPPIVVTPDRQTSALDPYSRVDFGAIHTIEHNLHVEPFGMVPQSHIYYLVNHFNAVWGINVPTSDGVYSVSKYDHLDSVQEDSKRPVQSSSRQDRIDSGLPPPDTRRPQIGASSSHASATSTSHSISSRGNPPPRGGAPIATVTRHEAESIEIWTETIRKVTNTCNQMEARYVKEEIVDVLSNRIEPDGTAASGSRAVQILLSFGTLMFDEHLSFDEAFDAYLRTQTVKGVPESLVLDTIYSSLNAELTSAKR